MSENRLHAALMAIVVAFIATVFVDAVRQDAAREAAAAQARTTHVAALPASATRP